MKKTLWICFTVTIVATSCTKPLPVPDSGTATAKNMPDVAYGDDPKQKIDIYLPAGRSIANTKTIVLIHGGGWTAGDKSDWASSIDSLMARLAGYALININYRLAYNSTTNLFPVQENDVQAAITYYLSRSAYYEISKDIVLLGASAGGHLSLLHGFKNDPDHHVKAIVDFFGPADLPALWNVGVVQQSILISATGKLIDQDPQLYAQSSPVNFINSTSPPTIVLQGGADPLVPPSQATILISKLQTANVVNQLVYYPTEQHGWSGLNLIDSFDKIQAFIAVNVH